MNSQFGNNSDFFNDTIHLVGEEIQVVSVFRIVASSLSVMGTILIITAYICLSLIVKCKKTRTNSVTKQTPQNEESLKMGYGHDLIFILSICDFMLSITSFIPTETPYTGIIDSNCIAQGFISNFFEVSSIIWTMLISFSIYLGTISKDVNKITRIYIFYFIYALSIPIVLSFGPLITNSYGPTGAWCWLKLKIRDPTASVWAFVIYIINWLHILLNIVFVCKSISYYKIRVFEIMENNKIEADYLKQYCFVLKFFPMILIVCWLPGTANRLYYFITKIENTGFYSFQAFFYSLQGFLNSLVYSYYYRNLIKTIFCHKGANQRTIKKSETNSNNKELGVSSINISSSLDSKNIELVEKVDS